MTSAASWGNQCQPVSSRPPPLGHGASDLKVGNGYRLLCCRPHPSGYVFLLPHPQLHLREREGHAVVRLLGDTKPCRTQPLSAPMQQWAASRGPGTGWDSLRRLVSPLPRDGALRFPAVSSPSPGPLVQAWGVQAGREVEALLCLSLAVFLMLPAPQVLWPRHSLSWDSGHSGHCWWVSPRGMGWPGHPLGSWKVRSCTSKASGPLPSGRMVPGSLCSPPAPGQSESGRRCVMWGLWHFFSVSCETTGGVSADLEYLTLFFSLGVELAFIGQS